MKNLVIINAGSFGRELYYIAKQSAGFGVDWIIKGFIDSSLNRLGEFAKFHPEGILSTINEYQVQADDVFICAIADTKLKAEFTQKIEEQGGKFINIIHRSAIILDEVQLGKGIIIGPACMVSCHAVIGDHSSLVANVAVGHDVKIGKYCQLNSFSHLGGFSIISDCCTMHPLSLLLPKVRLANDCVVGANSSVVRSVDIPKQTLFGNPAKSIL